MILDNVIQIQPGCRNVSIGNGTGRCATNCYWSSGKATVETDANRNGSGGRSATPRKSQNKPASCEKADGVTLVLKEGILCKKNDGVPRWKSSKYYALLDNGKFLVFPTKPKMNVCEARPKRFYVMRAVPILGLCIGIEKYMTHHQSGTEMKRWAFSVKIEKKGEMVERTFLCTSPEERDEWVMAFTELKDWIWAQQKKMEDFEIMRLLGEGYFGKVVLCREKATNHPYAMKIIKKSKVSKCKDLMHTLCEKRMLQNVIHPFLIHMKYSFQTPEKLCFVMEYVGGGELFNLLKHCSTMSEKNVQFYSSEVIVAIGFLHRCNVVYRDLKLENILVDKEGHVRLVDLGLCKELRSATDKTSTFCGTRECMAPEVLDLTVYGMSVDWWGVGIMMYELLFGHVPFRGDTVNAVRAQMLNPEVKFERDLEIETADIIRGLLRKDPQTRLGCGCEDMMEIQKHPFFSTISWDDVYAKKLTPPFVPILESDTDSHNFDERFTSSTWQSTCDGGGSNEELTESDKRVFEKVSNYAEEP